MIKAIHLRRDGRKKRHGQPEDKLGIAAFDGDAQCAFIEYFKPFHRIVIEIQPRVPGQRGKALGKRFHTDNILGHETQHGRRIERIGQALDGVRVIVGVYRPVASVRKIRYLSVAPAFCGGVKQVAGLPRIVECKRRVRLVVQIVA